LERSVVTMDPDTTYFERAAAFATDTFGRCAANKIPTPSGDGEAVPKPLNSEGCGDRG
jgi:hypothetical protein